MLFQSLLSILSIFKQDIFGVSEHQMENVCAGALRFCYE